eukprot:143199_1
MGFASSNTANVLVAPFIFDANDLLKDNPNLMGRFFAVFRHPIERAVNSFRAGQATDPEVANWTLEQYSASDKVENNYLTRKLSRQPTGDLT